MSRGGSQILFSGAQWQDKGNGHKLKHSKFHLKMWKNFFTLRALEQDAQSGCGFSFSEDIQNLPGHGPGQPWIPFQPLPFCVILWLFCALNQNSLLPKANEILISSQNL